MNAAFSQFGTALILVAATGFLVVSYIRYLRSRSERRMMRMLERAGLDPEFATHRDSEAVMQEIRRRCHKCQAEDVCERWLAGELTGENAFCPNRMIFEELAKRTQPA